MPIKDWVRSLLLPKVLVVWEHYEDGRTELVGIFSTRLKAEAAVPISADLLDDISPKRYHYYIEEITLDRRGS